MKEMNPKLEGIIERFSETYGLNDCGLPQKLEHFSNYVILLDEFHKLSEMYPYKSFINKTLIEDIDFGKDSTESIDGFFCLIQDKEEIIHMNTSKEDIKNMLKNPKNIKLKIVLIQTKSSKLDTDDINSLNIRLDSKSIDQKNWKKFFEFHKTLSEIIKNNSSSNYTIEFIYIYVLGANRDNELLKNPNFTYKLDNLKITMKELFWLNDDAAVRLEVYDKDIILNLYENIIKSTSILDKIIEFNEITDEQMCDKTSKFRVGIIKIKEYKKIIYDQDNKHPYQIYEYNVRHNLGETNINKNIISTIESSSNYKFPLLNNGITLVVDSMDRRGGDKSLDLKNIRVVNGCQTSHAIIKKCIDNIKYDEITIPIKIIATSNNEDLLREITLASNNQNTVTSENLLSLSKNIILLEKAYKEFSISNKKEIENEYYFERREGQYFNTDKKYVIDIHEQACIFIALSKGKPDMPLKYRARTVEEFKEIISKNESESFFDFCILSGILWNKINELIISNFSMYYVARYHIYICIFNKEIDLLEKNSLEVYLENIEIIKKNILNLIKDKDLLKNKIQQLINIISSIPELKPDSKNNRIYYKKFYMPEILNKMIQKLKEGK